MNENKIREAMNKARKNGAPTPSNEDKKVEIVSQPNTIVEEQAPLQAPDIKPSIEKSPQKELEIYESKAEKALEVVDDIVLKNYLCKLQSMKLVQPSNDGALKDKDFTLFKINKMVYEKDEYATDKFISVVNSMTYANCSIYLIVDGKGNHTDFYLGIKGEDENRTSSSIAKTFHNSLKGQFPGIICSDLSRKEDGDIVSKQERLITELTKATAISSYAGIPANRNSKGEYNNASFIQGIEKFAAAMQGQRYTAIVLATNTSMQEIVNIRNGYESIYTELSAMATQQLAYSTNESFANAFSRTKGTSNTHTESISVGDSDGTSRTNSTAKGDSTAKGHQESESRQNFWGKAGKIATPLIEAGAILAGTGVGAPIGVEMMGVGAVAGIGGIIGDKQKSKSDSVTETESTTYTTSDGITHTTTRTKSISDGHTDSFSETDGTTSTIGSSKNFTITCQNKHIQEILKRIDKQLERIEMSDSTGLWSVGTYFLSYDTDIATAETAASIFRSIMQGEQSGVETSAINSWYNNAENQISQNIVKYAAELTHPLFEYNTTRRNVLLTPTSLLSSKEVAMMIGLPRKSVPGLPVVDHISLAKEVVRLGAKKQSNSNLKLGCIFDQGQILNDNVVELDLHSLTQHTFVTGSTGCGKSNTIYYLIHQAQKHQPDIKFHIVEPAKGEYKNVFGNFDVYGTNPNISTLLKINPFRFPKGVHVLEHVDRLTEIFNVCWPMYAAMPAVLKEAILNSYEDCGWDLYGSTNEFSENLFPTFTDLLNELKLVILNSAYSEEVKSNYTGSLVTRVNSLAVGINKQIFCGNELGDEKLFDKNVIVDISRIGSQETKALIMGILIMRLNEYRSNSEIDANSGLRHITILEEAHNILKRCSTEQNMEGSNVAGKSVEMISNSIAEMRTYGEGFVIVDQSPGAVDISAIRNTNTKIIMRLPEETDRKVAGKAAAMKDIQIDEIAKLPTGVAVTYQNDWEEPVLCQISEFAGKPVKYQQKTDNSGYDNCSTKVKNEILKLLLKGKTSGNVEPDIITIKEGINTSGLSSFDKITIFKLMNVCEEGKTTNLWKKDGLKELSRLVTEITGLKDKVTDLIKTIKNVDSLDQELSKIIHENIPELSPELDMELKRCLIYDNTVGDEIKSQIYNIWLKQAKLS